MTKRHLLIFLFILCCLNASAQIQPLPFSNYIEKRGGLNNIAYAINQKTVTVAFLGGSITYNPACRIVYFLLNK